jgi:hypothetical protein
LEVDTLYDGVMKIDALNNLITTKKLIVGNVANDPVYTPFAKDDLNIINMNKTTSLNLRSLSGNNAPQPPVGLTLSENGVKGYMFYEDYRMFIGSTYGRIMFYSSQSNVFGHSVAKEISDNKPFLETTGGEMGIIGMELWGNKLVVNGSVEAIGFISTSDQLLKTNIIKNNSVKNNEILTYMLNKSPALYNRNDLNSIDNNKKRIGYIANDFQNIKNDLGIDNIFFDSFDTIDPDTNKTEHTFKKLDYSRFGPLLHSCIIAQNEKIISQQTRIDNLEARLLILEERILNP